MTVDPDEPGILGPCRTCARPVRLGDARYTIFEPEEFEHYECKATRDSEYEVAATRLKDSADKAAKALEGLRRTLR